MAQESEVLDKFTVVARTLIAEIGSSFGRNLEIPSEKVNLIYEWNWHYKPVDIRDSDAVEVTRGRGGGAPAFQADFCVVERNQDGKTIPRVVIEFKTGVTTHDIITYSAKAGKHKRIYPYLRYGLISSKNKAVTRKFFCHNEHIDFYIAAYELLTKEKIVKFVRDVLIKEIQTSIVLEELYYSSTKDVNYYRTAIELSKNSE